MAGHHMFYSQVLLVAVIAVSAVKGSQISPFKFSQISTFKSSQISPFKGSQISPLKGCIKIHLTVPDGARFLTTPNYPGNYPTDTDICWVVDAKRIDHNLHSALGYRLHVIVEDYHLPPSYDCHSNALEFRDGPTENSTLLARWCSKTPPRVPLLSISDVLYIRFQSDNSKHQISPGYGFQLRVQALAEAPLGPPTDSKCKQLSIASSDMMYIMTSPNYPHHYTNNQDLCYVINLKLTKGMKGLDRVRFEIHDSNLESSKGCSHDYVEVFDADSPDGKSIVRWCGEGRQRKAVTSTGTSLCVRFKSDASGTHQGFHATFFADGKAERGNALRRKKKATYYSYYRYSSYYYYYYSYYTYYYTYYYTTYRRTYYSSYKTYYTYIAPYVNTGPIVGGVIGGLTFIGLVVAGIVITIKVCCKKSGTPVRPIQVQPQYNGQSMGQSMGQPRGQPRGQPMGQPMGQSMGQSQPGSNIPSVHGAPPAPLPLASPPPSYSAAQGYAQFQNTSKGDPTTAAPY